MARAAEQTNTAQKTAPLTPHLCVSPADEAIKFYEKAFGATLLFRADTPDGKRILHASMHVMQTLIGVESSLRAALEPALAGFGSRITWRGPA